MPLTIPTPKEIRAMSPQQRADMRRKLRPLLADLDDALRDFDRHDAHAWMVEYGIDPDAETHRAILAEAIR